MLIGNIFLRNGMVVVRDVDNSEIEFTPNGALELSHWIVAHWIELYEIESRTQPLGTQAPTEAASPDSEQSHVEQLEALLSDYVVTCNGDVEALARDYPHSASRIDAWQKERDELRRRAKALLGE